MKRIFRFVWTCLRGISAAIGVGARAFVALVGIAGVTAAVANYAMTQGSGTNFGSILVSSVHYVQMLVCDSVTPANCAKVQAGNAAAVTDVAMTVTDANLLAAANAPTPAGNNVIGQTKQTDGTTIALTDPCQGSAGSYTPINIAASGSIRIIAGSATKQTYICQFHINNNTAEGVALTEGTGTNCGTSTVGIVGGTTAATGYNFAANGGISVGVGRSWVMKTATAADDVCLNPGASTQLTGGVRWVQQ